MTILRIIAASGYIAFLVVGVGICLAEIITCIIGKK